MLRTPHRYTKKEAEEILLNSKRFANICESDPSVSEDELAERLLSAVWDDQKCLRLIVEKYISGETGLSVAVSAIDRIEGNDAYFSGVIKRASKKRRTGGIRIRALRRIKNLEYIESEIENEIRKNKFSFLTVDSLKMRGEELAREYPETVKKLGNVENWFVRTTALRLIGTASRINR